LGHLGDGISEGSLWWYNWPKLVNQLKSRQ